MLDFSLFFLFFLNIQDKRPSKEELAAFITDAAKEFGTSEKVSLEQFLEMVTLEVDDDEEDYVEDDEVAEAAARVASMTVEGGEGGK